MTFYNRWKYALETNMDYTDYVISFLNKDNESDEVFQDGSLEELHEALDVISKVSFKEFFSAFNGINLEYELRASDVPQFSNMEHGLIRVPELLAFTTEGLSYYDIGYQIVKATKEGACIKYGENHAKLASLFSLVKISNTRPAIVTNTSLGSLLTSVPYEEKKDLFRKLLMRDRFMKKLLYEALNGFVYYEDIVSFISPSTALRRRPNVKRLTEFILSHTEYEIYYRNISW